MGPLMQYLAWLSRLGLDEEQAAQANQERDSQLAALAALGLGNAFKGTKPHYGRLSPGCLTCGSGSWSCLYLNRLCTANCFFCPQDRSQREEQLPTAEAIAFADPDAYVEYLRRFGFRGVGISGGETFLAFERLVAFVEAVRKGLGPAVHLWVYTNGDLVDRARLERLRRAGLDELRLNVSARGYDLGPVALARALLETVTVEIPVLPEDYTAVDQCMLDLDRLGVDHLNLHQLVATQHNYQRLAQRDYTFLPPLAFHESPVHESESVALGLLQTAAKRRLALSVHYCSQAYKAQYQTLARRKRGAEQATEALERITEAGYIRRTSVVDAPDEIAQLVDHLQQAGADGKLWAWEDSGRELYFDPSLRPVISLEGRALGVRYFEAQIVSQGYLKAKGLGPLTEVELVPGQQVWIGRKLVAHKELRGVQIQPYEQMVSETNLGSAQAPEPALLTTATSLPVEPPVRQPSPSEVQSWAELMPLERLSRGFPSLSSKGSRSGGAGPEGF